MEQFTWEVVKVLLGIAGVAITTFCAFAARIIHKWSSEHTANNKTTKEHPTLKKEVENLDEKMGHVEGCLSRDDKRISALEEDTKLMLRVQLELLDHSIEGNHVERMKSVRNELEEYLIAR